MDDTAAQGADELSDISRVSQRGDAATPGTALDDSISPLKAEKGKNNEKVSSLNIKQGILMKQ